MTQVARILPLWYDVTPAPKRKAVPNRGWSDQNANKGGNGRLTADDVRAIRLAGEWDWPAALVGRLWGIRPEYATMIMVGYTHAHVR